MKKLRAFERGWKNLKYSRESQEREDRVVGKDGMDKENIKNKN